MPIQMISAAVRQDERRQRRPDDPCRSTFSPEVDRVAEVAVEDAVRGAADRGSAGSWASPSGRGSVGSPRRSRSQMPIQRQYWIGIGWSRPQAFMKACLRALRHPGVVGELRLGTARSGEQDDRRHDDRDADQSTGIAWITRLMTYLVIGSAPVSAPRLLPDPLGIAEMVTDVPDAGARMVAHAWRLLDTARGTAGRAPRAVALWH